MMVVGHGGVAVWGSGLKDYFKDLTSVPKIGIWVGP